MTLLRRAPREVYRVYGEDDFFARAEQEPFVEPTQELAVARTPAPVLRRLAGPTILVALVGALGGLATIACSLILSVARAHPAAHLLAETGPPGARAQAERSWRQAPASAAGSSIPRQHGQRAARASLARGVAAAGARETSRALAASVPQTPAGPRASGAPAEVASASASSAVPATAAEAAAAPAAPAAPVPAPPAQSALAARRAPVPQPVQVEFGFER